jgi:3-dehydroquinate dehydratase-2
VTQILILHGPNLNLLGERQPEIYGSLTLPELDERIRAEGERLGVETKVVQSNHEGVLIDELHSARTSATGAVVNPGGLSHTSISLRDAILAVEYPVVEVHLSNIHAREHFRRRSLTAGACLAVITGLGWRGYVMGLQAIVELTREDKSNSDR